MEDAVRGAGVVITGAEPGLTDNQVSAIYDWDSVALGPRTSVGRQRIGDAPDRRAARAARPTDPGAARRLRPTTRQYALRHSATTSTKSSPPANDGSPVMAPAARTPTTYSASSPTSISRGAAPPPATRRFGAVTDRMIGCATAAGEPRPDHQGIRRSRWARTGGRSRPTEPSIWRDLPHGRLPPCRGACELRDRQQLFRPRRLRATRRG
jgi:hypothetical protein